MRQAVVIIHGIGEQRPMDTIRAFVTAITDGLVRNKPDRLSESFELRRFAIAQSQARPPTDVYELYWAHHMKRARWAAVFGWMRNLIWRRPSSLPPGLRGVHRALWTSTFLAVAAAAVPAVMAYRSPNEKWLGDVLTSATTYLPVLVFLAQGLFGRVVLGYIGDAARYLTPDPDNIEARTKIRAEGVRLLRKLHCSCKYYRILVVGHSLGSVIGYDVLHHLWDEMRMPSFEKARRQPEAKGFQGAVDAVNDPPEGVSRATAVNLFQQAQHRLWREQRKAGTPWLVTDFVTLGSPLAHARVLLENPHVTFERRKAERELPTCPPNGGDEDVHYFETHDLDDGTSPRKWDFRIPHHGAVFSGTRWTNLYFPHTGLIFGDVVGGPLAPVFGSGIRDLPVRPNERGFWPKTLKSHVLYWQKAIKASPETKDERREKDRRTGTKEAILALRSALQLDAKKSKEPWPEPCRRAQSSMSVGSNSLSEDR